MKIPFWKSNKQSDEIKSANEAENSSKNRSAAQIAEKIGHYFNPEPQKEKVLRHEDFQAAGDVYYASVSAMYKIAQRILCVLLVAFLLISILTNYREITYDNFFYLIKDFSSAVDADSTNYETLSYDSDSRHQFALYRGGLAIVNPSSVSAFSATGRRTLRLTSDFSSPFVVTSDQYLLAYDTSGTTFSVYTSFSKVYTETKDYPITDACFASDNSFVVVSRSDRSKAVIYSYSKNFKPQAEMRYSYYLLDVALNSDNNQMVSVGYDNGEGIGRTMISLREYPFVEENGADVYMDLAVDGEFPLACGFLENGRIAVITDSAIRIYDNDLEEIQSQSYSEKSVRGFHISSQGAAVSTVYASQNEIIAFDRLGNLLYHDFVASNVTEVGVYGDIIFLKVENGVIRLTAQNGKEERLPSGDGKLLLYNDKTVLVCGEAKAEYLVFD